MQIESFKDLAAEAAKRRKKTVVAVVEAQDEHTLESVVEATEDGIISPVLIGNAFKVQKLLVQLGADASKFEIMDSADTDESLQTAIALIHMGKANAIMKGRLESGEFMRAIVRKENSLVPEGGKLSLIGFYETLYYHKIFAVSDMGLNTYPDVAGKKLIIENAVELMHALGNRNPKVAVLSSVERVNPKMPDAVDGAALKAMNASGALTGCIVEGPISFDLATSKEAAQIKGYKSPVAGDADLLIVPDIAAGNILVKCLTGFCGAQDSRNRSRSRNPGHSDISFGGSFG